MSEAAGWEEFDDDEDFDDELEYVMVDAHNVEWGATNLGWCPSCLVTHEWVNIYTYVSNPMDAELLGVLWLCDEDDDEEGEDDE